MGSLDQHRQRPHAESDRCHNWPDGFQEQYGVPNL